MLVSMSSTPQEGARPRPFEEPASVGDPRLDELARLGAVVDRLRDPDGGCPWDLEQSVESMAPSLVEEAHECVEAIETEGDAEARGELGDVLLVCFVIARIAEQNGRFDLGSAARAASDKLLRRHPHVFGDADAADRPHALENWERAKRSEQGAEGRRKSAVDGVPLAMPALQRTYRIGHKAVAAGFRWNGPSGALAKLREELGELEQELAAAGLEEGSSELPPEAPRQRIQEELGDVLLAAAQLGTYLELDPERALRDALRRFEGRFRLVEQELGEDLQGASLDRIRAAWARAKQGLQSAAPEADPAQT